MRIAHVVTYVSEDGAFGGPVAVAVAQTEALAARGHEVTLFAGWDGKALLHVAGVDVRLFRACRIGPGLSGLFAPGLLAALRRERSTFDVVHVHLGRDLVTLPSARLALGAASAHVVLQPHGMVMPDPRRRARVLDAIATRAVLSRAKAVLALTERELDGVREVAAPGRAKLSRIPNGVRTRDPEELPVRDPRTVLFLARLHPRKRVLSFAGAARILRDGGSDLRFRVVGPDEGDLAELERYISAHGLGGVLDYAGAVPPGAGVRELAAASAYVLPSRDEVFPMTVLEAMSVGTPVVLADDCAIAPDLHARGAVSLTTGSEDDLAKAIERLFADGALAAEQSARAIAALEEWLSIDAVADELERTYA